jgi:hypothetical protein
METFLTYAQIFAWFYLISWVIICSAVTYGLVHLWKKFRRKQTDGVV